MCRVYENVQGHTYNLGTYSNMYLYIELRFGLKYLSSILGFENNMGLNIYVNKQIVCFPTVFNFCQVKKNYIGVIISFYE